MLLLFYQPDDRGVNDLYDIVFTISIYFSVEGECVEVVKDLSDWVLSIINHLGGPEDNRHPREGNCEN